MLCHMYIACVVLDGLYWGMGWYSSTGPGMADGGCCRYVLFFFIVSVYQSVVLCCISVTHK